MNKQIENKTAQTPLTVAEAIRRVIYLPMTSVTVTNFHAPLPAGCCYATPQDRVEDLIRAAERACNSNDALVAALEALTQIADCSNDFGPEECAEFNRAYDQAVAALKSARGES